MSDRHDEIIRFLQGTPWESWTQTPLAGDASARRYLRLTKDGKNVVLMDADPKTGQSTKSFARIAHWLRAAKLSAPAILKHDMAAGLMVTEDLGPDDLVRWIARHPQDIGKLYQAATDVLIELDGLTPPVETPVMTPQVGGEMLDVTCAWYAKDADNQDLIRAMRATLAELCTPPQYFALRDYHAENLIWQSNKLGTDRIGLLDFQDAFVAPRGYDLVSLIKDVRRKVDPVIATRMTAHFAKHVGTTPQALAPAMACLGVQRNLRILGVFARLALRDCKARYVQMIPHLWDMITTDLNHPALRDLKSCVAATLPPPEHSAIKDLL